MTCFMEILNFMEECEKPAPTLCFDIMELVGDQVNIIRKNQEYKKKYDECIKALNNSYYYKSELDRLAAAVRFNSL
jgi:hypothetical protein